MSLVLINQEIRACHKCDLCHERWKAVPGAGSPTADIVLIGEAPGTNENAKGLPFIGRAGAVLDSILQTFSLTRQEIFLCNVLKCQPPSNRDPLPAELEACLPYLDRQLAFIKPRLVIGLGNFSIQYLFPGLEPKQARGTFRNNGQFLATATYHPAAVLRGRPALKDVIVEDIRKGLAWLGKPVNPESS